MHVLHLYSIYPPAFFKSNTPGWINIFVHSLLLSQPLIYSLGAWFVLSSITAAIIAFMLGITGIIIYFFILTCINQVKSKGLSFCLANLKPLFTQGLVLIFSALVVFLSVLYGINHYFNNLWI